MAREHVGSDSWPTTSLSSGVWLHLVCAGAFVVVGATLNALHPVFANRGYQHGRVVLISTHTALVSMASGVFVGIAVLVRAPLDATSRSLPCVSPAPDLNERCYKTVLCILACSRTKLGPRAL